MNQINADFIGKPVIWARCTGVGCQLPTPAKLRALLGTDAVIDVQDRRLARIRALRVPMAHLERAAEPLPDDWPAALR